MTINVSRVLYVFQTSLLAVQAMMGAPWPHFGISLMCWLLAVRDLTYNDSNLPENTP